MITVQTKICSRCQQELPATRDFFYGDKRTKDGFVCKCKKCISKEKKKYYQENKERIMIYRRANKEKIRQQRKIYKKTPGARAIERRCNRERLKKNPEEIRRYNQVHNWVRKRKPKQEYCTICNEYGHRIELANITGEYKKDIMDYIWLCTDCHYVFDLIRKTHEMASRSNSKINNKKEELNCQEKNLKI